MVLESLVPALDSLTSQKKMPEHIVKIEADGIKQVKLIDATPIGINIRSTVATYANIHDELRKILQNFHNQKKINIKPEIFV